MCIKLIKYLIVVLIITVVIQVNFYGTVWSEGNTKEDFTVLEANGPRSFTLSRAKGSYVALHFLLKTTCPLCMLYTHEFTTRAPEVPGVYHVFLKPDTEEEINTWSKQLDSKYAEISDTAGYVLPIIYRDPNAELAKVYDIPFGYEFHKQTVHYPALIILGPDGKEVFRYIGKGTQDRYTFDTFITKMAELRGLKK